MALQQIANTDISSTGTFALGSVSSSALTSGRVTYATTGGLLTDSSSLTYNGTILTSAAFSGALNGTVGATTPSTVVATSVTNSGLTSGRITYASTGGLLVDSANLVFSGTSLAVGHTSTGGATFGVASGGNEIFQVFAAFSSNLNLVQNYNYASSVYVANENRASLYSWKIGTTEAMRITSAGLVGIGTSSPSYKLSIKGDSATSNNILLTHDTDTTGA